MKRLYLLLIAVCPLFYTACAAQPGEPVPYQQPQTPAVEASASIGNKMTQLKETK